MISTLARALTSETKAGLAPPTLLNTDDGAHYAKLKMPNVSSS
jgi:hypothetical protein